MSTLALLDPFRMGCDIYVSRGNGHIGPVAATGNFLVLRGAGPGLAQAFVLLRLWSQQLCSTVQAILGPDYMANFIPG